MAGTVAVGGGLALLVPGPLDDGTPTPSLEESAEAQARSVPAAWDRVRVEVLNGGGVAGVAGRARDHLRDQGFDVVHFGNASSFGETASFVVDHGTDAGMAAAVASSLGIGDVRLAPDPVRLVDVTVLLGADWSGAPPSGPDAADSVPVGAARAAPWRDLVKFLQGVREGTGG